MKRSVIAISLALLASPALALEVGPPFEQLQVDRALPDIRFAAKQGDQYAQSAAAGNTRTDASPDAEGTLESPWANDFHFVAPPQ